MGCLGPQRTLESKEAEIQALRRSRRQAPVRGGLRINLIISLAPTFLRLPSCGPAAITPDLFTPLCASLTLTTRPYDIRWLNAPAARNPALM